MVHHDSLGSVHGRVLLGIRVDVVPVQIVAVRVLPEVARRDPVGVQQRHQLQRKQKKAERVWLFCTISEFRRGAGKGGGRGWTMGVRFVKMLEVKKLEILTLVLISQGLTSSSSRPRLIFLRFCVS